MGMLVLGRTVEQSICIGNDVVVKVLKVDANGLVHLGIKAPKDVPVDREEIRAAKEAEDPERFEDCY